jgi:aspartate-semialdehyde dehydrogenase
MKQKINVAVVGATGAVGGQMLEVLEQRNFPVGKIRPLASSRSAGEKISFKDKDYTVEELKEDSFKDIQIALFSAGGKVSEKFCPIAAESGAVCVDNTSVFRMDPQVPLVVPEVNPDAIAEYKTANIIANPNCSTIQMVVALAPLHRAVPIKRVVVTTFQAVSGAGRRAINELATQAIAIFNQKPIKTEVFPHQIAFNCLPHIDVFMANAYTREEMKMIRETRKIMSLPDLPVTATCVRVPVFACHSESINIEFEGKMTPDMAREILSGAPGVVVVDDPAKNQYPLNIHCATRDETFVGRIRADESVENGINMWCVSDNLRKGAATNAVQIAEVLYEKYL